ncbi:MAG TPA: hypothetical protein VK308_03600, partial [Pyrinomonadaceae bacterium]|nr:hypothetical protein [Pyrinomonadaceae bacterium]
GKRVVFASQRTGKYEIWIADSDGANARQLTDFKNAPVGSPRFSPDGKQIVFDAQVSGNGDIYQISADGGAPRRLTEEASFDSHPAWSADGSFVFFASDRSGSAQIYRMPVGGGEALRITRNGGRESYAAPDGKSLYYSKGDGGLWRISLENGGGEQPIAALAEAAAWRYWTLSGNGIYFVRRSNYPPFKLMFYDIATDAAKEAATIEAAPIWVYPGLGASPDGKVIYFAQADQNASSIAIAEIGK